MDLIRPENQVSNLELINVVLEYLITEFKHNFEKLVVFYNTNVTTKYAFLNKFSSLTKIYHFVINYETLITNAIKVILCGLIMET